MRIIIIIINNNNNYSHSLFHLFYVWKKLAEYNTGQVSFSRHKINEINE